MDPLVQLGSQKGCHVGQRLPLGLLAGWTLDLLNWFRLEGVESHQFTVTWFLRLTHLSADWFSQIDFCQL